MGDFVKRITDLLGKNSRKDMSDIQVSVIVVPGRTSTQTKRLLTSLEHKHFYGSYDLIQAESEQAAAVNQAVCQATGEYIVFLRGNTEVTEGWLDSLLESYRSAALPGAVGMTGLYPEKNKKGVPAGTVREQGVAFQEQQGKQRTWMTPCSIEAAGGGSGLLPCTCAGYNAFMVGKHLIDEAGGFDERLLADEAFLDFQLRLQLSGYQNYCSADSKIYIYGVPKEQDEERKKLRNGSRNIFRCRWQKYLAEKKQPITKNPMEIDICGAMPEDETKKFWGDWHYALALQKELKRLGYKANIITREHWYDTTSAGVVLVLRGVRRFYPSAAGESKYIMWNISHPDSISIDEYDMYNYVFFASDRMYQKLRFKIKPQSEALLQCVDPEVMSCFQDTAAAGKKEQGAVGPELLFVGNSRHVYRQILKDLLPTKHELHVYGRHWEDLPVQEYVVADYMDNAKVGQAYHDAGILLNDHWEDMRSNGIISNRIFDALAAGAFVISDDMPELAQLFHGAVVTYENRQDLEQKIDYYLSHEEERREKAAQGQEIVLKEHTFANRAEKIAKVVERMLYEGV